MSTSCRPRASSTRPTSAQTVASVAVPAGDSLTMSPYDLDVTVAADPDWRPGDLVSFTLHFERSGAVNHPVVVVRRGQDGT
ncbi:hypothetical protein GCM10023080_026780 [Streptomyces pseudoechinosporeus]